MTIHDGLPSPTGATTRAVVLARYRSAAPDGTDSEAHLLPLPLRGTADTISALCGTALPLDRLDIVTPGQGRWCTLCFLAHVTGAPLPVLATPGASGAGTVTECVTAGVAYRRLGWPVTLHRNQVVLNLDLDVDAAALILPAVLATEVTDILLRRRCPPPVLVHPALPAHRVIIAGERYPVPLGWPVGVHRITSTLPLPPTVTDRGPISWVRPPVPHALQLCREIDVFTALRAISGQPKEPHP